jgi:hypothetical protein
MTWTWLLRKSLNWKLQAKPLGTAGTGSAWECVIFSIFIASSSLSCWLSAYIRGIYAGPLDMNFKVSSSFLGFCLRLAPAWGYDSIFFFNFFSWLVSYQLRFEPCKQAVPWKEL